MSRPSLSVDVDEQKNYGIRGGELNIISPLAGVVDDDFETEMNDLIVTSVKFLRSKPTVGPATS